MEFFAHVVRSISIALLVLSPGSLLAAQSHTPNSGATGRETVMTTRANGTFEVKLTPLATGENATSALGQLTIDKQFHGDLDGVSRGIMLAAGTSLPNSAGYVALERVSGSLAGHQGTFVLQHSGTMNRGAAQLVISVVPDSGTDELVGLSGTMVIIIAEGKHSYEFEYVLGGAR